MIDQLLEALKQKKAELSEINFTKSGLDDPHIKKIIAYVVKKTGKKEADIKKAISDEIVKVQELKKKAPVLYHTIVENIAEGEAFKLLSDLDVEDAPKFNIPTFYRLVRRIRVEHDSLFPLRNFVNPNKRLENPRYVIVPDPREKHFNSINTAAATPSGEFIFNAKFCQKLLDFAHLKNIKPKGKKYEANGGDFANEWCLVEFVILHEFMHYTYADFHYSKIYKADPLISNWVGDFRSNYDLVKNGHEQLPIGLFNDLVNMDRQKTWKEMYDIVEAEFKKLNASEKMTVEVHLGDIEGPSHPNPGQQKGGGEKGDGEEKDGDDKDKDPGAGDEKKEDKDSKEKGEGESKDSSDEKDPDEITPEDVEKHEQEVRQRGQANKETGTEDEAEQNNKKRGISKQGGADKTQTVDNSTQKFDYSKIQPKLSWKQLLSKLLKNASGEEEPTYQKPSRRSITSTHIAKQTGQGAVKPGDILVEQSKLKIVFVIDSSGSMGSAIAEVYSNINNLLKSKASGLDSEFILIKFSNNFKIYVCKHSGSGTGSYKEVASMAGLKRTDIAKMDEGDLNKLFTEHFGNATNFSGRLISELEYMMDNKFNVVLVTDTDILDGKNADNLVKLYRHAKSQMFMIADSKTTFSAICQRLKEISANITHM